MKHLLIIGVGGFGREVFWLAQQSRGYETEFDLKGYLNGDTRLPDEEYKKLNLPVLGDINDYEIQPDDVFTCAIGSSAPREKIMNRMKDRGAKFISLIHNSCYINGPAKVGEGVIFSVHVVIGDHASIGDGVVLNTNTAVGHDAVVEDYVSTMSFVDITGFCHIGKRAYFGSGARVLPEGKVGEDARVGAGAVVLRRVEPGTTVYGNPAKRLI